MKLTFIICMLISFSLTKGNKDEINDGASPSTSNVSDDRQTVLNRLERCEINIYVDEAINLVLEELLSSEREDSDLHMVRESDRSTYVREIDIRLRYGANYASNLESMEVLPNYRQRRDYFVSIAVNSARDRMIEIFTYENTHCSQSRNHQNSVQFNPLFAEMPRIDLYDLMTNMLTSIGITYDEIHRDLDIRGESRQNSRSKRSFKKSGKKCFSIEEFSQNRWNKFVLYLTSVLMKFYYLEESAAWLCDYVLLYNDYKKHQSPNDNCTRPTFNNHLYTKISQLEEGHVCMDFDESRNQSEWCQAWRRIMLNSDLDYSIEVNKNNPERLKRDLEIIVHWLSKRISFVNQKTSPKLPLIITTKNNTVCYKDESTLSCPNICRSSNYRVMSARARRAISAPEDVIYEREWLKDINNNSLRCRCPEDDSTSILQTTGNWLSNLFGNKWKTRCDNGSPDRETPRCDEFRRK